VIVKAVKITLRLSAAQSLKDKRRVVRSLVDQIRRRFNVAVAEVAAHDDRQLAVLGLASVSNSAYIADQVLDKVVHLIESRPEVELLEIEDY
jgi:uncharacterized protein YlxP (DUF503 family)